MIHRSRQNWKALALLLLLGACRAEPSRPQPTPAVIWKPVGHWTGRGDKQTETFTSDSGGFRVHWKTANETPAGSGRLRVVFRSGDSGREIIEAIDARGEGGGTEEVAADRPRWFYVTIESANVDWTVSIDERVEAVRQAGPPLRFGACLYRHRQRSVLGEHGPTRGRRLVNRRFAELPYYTQGRLTELPGD